MDLLVYDIETARLAEETPGGWGNVYGMGLGSVVIYSYMENKYYEYLHNSSREEIKNKLNGNKVITFNGMTFDSKVLLGNNRIMEPNANGLSVTISSADRKTSWVEFDIFRHCLKNMFGKQTIMESVNLRSRGNNNLDKYAENTLGSENVKTGHGKDAPKLYQNGEYEKLIKYNKQDVFITKQLYEHAKNNGFLINGNGDRTTISIGRK